MFIMSRPFVFYWAHSRSLICHKSKDPTPNIVQVKLLSCPVTLSPWQNWQLGQVPNFLKFLGQKIYCCGWVFFPDFGVLGFQLLGLYLQDFRSLFSGISLLPVVELFYTCIIRTPCCTFLRLPASPFFPGRYCVGQSGNKAYISTFLCIYLFIYDWLTDWLTRQRKKKVFCFVRQCFINIVLSSAFQRGTAEQQNMFRLSSYCCTPILLWFPSTGTVLVIEWK